ncbi:MAG: sterol desaturase family protein [Gammaproteobacteria bacterium]|nr:sterol desaturase family protein [Gammaproteobacteria bacterium]
MDLVPYAVPFFLLAIGLEYAWGRARGNDTYRLNDSINSLSCGILSTSIKLLGLDIGGRVFTQAEQHWALARLDAQSPWTWLLALLLYDFCYYWFHRISHERTLFWAAHVVHHQSEEFNLTTALRQTSTGFLAGWVFYIPCFVAGVPAAVFVTVASAHLIYQFWIHSRHIPKLGPLEWVLVTASNHRVHHAQNPAYVDKNYGGLLIVWDRLFGTFEEERDAEPPVYGILGPLQSWNPLWANLHIYAQMWRDAWYTRRWSDKLRVLLARTGWRPDDVAARFPVVKRPLAEFRRYDPPLAPRAAWYAGLQFLALMAFALWLEQAAPAMHATGRAALFACLLFGLVAIGVMLEQLPRGRALERLRLGVTLAAVLGLAVTGVAAWPVAAVLIAYLAASVILLARTSSRGAALSDS